MITPKNKKTAWNYIREIYPKLKKKDLPSVSFQELYICCGRPNCSTCRGHRYMHGIYKYAYWHDPKTKKTRSLYLGKGAPIKILG